MFPYATGCVIWLQPVENLVNRVVYPGAQPVGAAGRKYCLLIIKFVFQNSFTHLIMQIEVKTVCQEQGKSVPPTFRAQFCILIKGRFRRRSRLQTRYTQEATLLETMILVNLHHVHFIFHKRQISQAIVGKVCSDCDRDEISEMQLMIA